jgi:two-component system repressor protein LuxO
MGSALRHSSALRLLLVDADPFARRVLRVALEARIARSLSIMETADLDAACALMADGGFDAAAVDLATVGGAEGFARVMERARNTSVYAVGEPSNVSGAVIAVRAGAADYLEKPLDGASFARRIERQFAPTPMLQADAFEGLIGRSPVMRALFDQISKIAPSPAPVFIAGEPGTGKRAVARAVHARSRVAAGPFITVDCGAGILPADAFQSANGGTLYLHGVDRLEDEAQASLISFLSAGFADRGRITLRLIASSNKAGGRVVGPGAIRQDLFYRINVMTLVVPPLRERREDVRLIVEDAIRRISRKSGVRPPRLSTGALDLLADHGWPGNLRDLDETIGHLVSDHPGDAVSDAAVSPLLAKRPAAARVNIRPLWMEEARLIEEAITAFDGNIAKAAAALEISPSTIYRKRRPAGDDQGHQERA